jgi:hypothetical protein
MTLQELQNQALELPLGDRWRLVQSLLHSIQQATIQQETLLLSSPNSDNPVATLDPWTRSLMGVIQLDTEKPIESYVDSSAQC